MKDKRFFEAKLRRKNEKRLFDIENYQQNKLFIIFFSKKLIKIFSACSCFFRKIVYFFFKSSR